MSDYEQRFGKACITLPSSSTHIRDMKSLPEPDNTAAAGAVVVSASPVTTGTQRGAVIPSSSTSALRTYAEWYIPPTSATPASPSRGSQSCVATAAVRAVPTVEYFRRVSCASGRKQEEYLWTLMQDVYADSEQSDQYHPDAIGIESVQPHRRWFVSQYAHIQAFLQRQPLLRRATIICRWLESTYRDDSRQEPRLRGEDEVVLRQIILSYLRGGELSRAINAAVTYGSCVQSCILSAAQLQTVQEPWFSQTALVPLFGEYAHGELDQAWCGNEYRLENLSQLYEESCKHRSAVAAAVGLEGGAGAPTPSAVSDFDAVIAAALCGNLSVLESAFQVNGGWKDMVWCYLRCALVVAFTKQLMVATGGGGENAGRLAPNALDRNYAVFIEEMTGSEDNWAVSFSQTLTRRLATRLQSGFLTRVSLEEQLQMRFILQALMCADGDGTRLPTALMAAPALTGTTEWFDILPEEGNSDAARLITHVLLAQDVAYGETISPHAVQVRAGASLAMSLARYGVFLALLPRYPFDEGLRALTAMTLRLRDPRHRASVYTAFIIAAREYELQRQNLSRSELEEQEARLVRQFVTADPDANVHAEVQQLLYQQIAPTKLLTHNKLAEKLMWEAMHAHSLSDYLVVLRRGVSACCSFWLAQPEPEVEAIADVSSILTRRVLVDIQRWCDTNRGSDIGALTVEATSTSPMTLSPSASPVSDLERSEATFWYVLSETRGIAREHAAITAQLNAAKDTTAFSGPAASSNRTLIYQLTQDEAALLIQLADHTRRGVRHGGAVVHRDRQCLTAIVSLVQQLTEAVTLSMLSGLAEGDVEEDSPAPRDDLSRMQQVYGLMEELHSAGYLDPALLPQQSASALYAQIRAMRVSYGQRVHRRQVLSALRQRANRSAARVDRMNAVVPVDSS